jgi:Na+/H+ antiporter NhaD/arsenite permease-like protein
LRASIRIVVLSGIPYNVVTMSRLVGAQVAGVQRIGILQELALLLHKVGRQQPVLTAAIGSSFFASSKMPNFVRL